MPLPKEERYTLADVLTWDEQERVELIDGAPVMMAPPSRIHQKISAELGRQLGNYLEGKKCEVYAAPFAVRLFEKAGDRLTKYNLYQRAGVREYWIVDPAARSIQSFVLEDGHYTAAGFGSPGDVLKVNVLDGCFIELSKVFPET